MSSHLAQTVRLSATENSLSGRYTVIGSLLLREAGAGWLSGQAQSSRQAYLHVVVSGIDRDRCHRIVSADKHRLRPVVRTQLAVLNTRIAAATTRLLLAAGETGNTRRAVCRRASGRLGMEARGRHVFRAGPGGDGIWGASGGVSALGRLGPWWRPIAFNVQPSATYALRPLPPPSAVPAEREQADPQWHGALEVQRCGGEVDGLRS